MQAAVRDAQIPVKRAVAPDLVVAPLVGFDRARYRPGNRGGYFNRPLTALTNRPFAVGAAYANSELEPIYPRAHDVTLDVIVTEKS